MNRGQRITLITILLINFVMSVYRPYEQVAGYRTLPRGYHWNSILVFLDAEPNNYRIEFERLAAQVAIVSIVGFIVFLLTGAKSSKGDNRNEAGNVMRMVFESAPAVGLSIIRRVFLFLLFTVLVIGGTIAIVAAVRYIHTNEMTVR
jgi:hypothetical protein